MLTGEYTCPNCKSETGTFRRDAVGVVVGLETFDGNSLDFTYCDAHTSFTTYNHWICDECDEDTGTPFHEHLFVKEED